MLRARPGDDFEMDQNRRGLDLDQTSACGHPYNAGMYGNSLTLELAALCAIKLIAVGVLYVLLFGPSHRPIMETAMRVGGPAWSSPSGPR